VTAPRAGESQRASLLGAQLPPGVVALPPPHFPPLGEYSLHTLYTCVSIGFFLFFSFFCFCMCKRSSSTRERGRETFAEGAGVVPASDSEDTGVCAHGTTV